MVICDLYSETTGEKIEAAPRTILQRVGCVAVLTSSPFTSRIDWVD
jgi:glutamine synthetase